VGSKKTLQLGFAADLVENTGRYFRSPLEIRIREIHELLPNLQPVKTSKLKVSKFGS
jgi:hypothetical protein